MKRLRIFAGPNGSGKSTIYKNLISKGDINFGLFVNADEIEQSLKRSSIFDFSKYSIDLDFDEFCNEFKESGYYQKSSNAEGLLSDLRQEEENTISIKNTDNIDSYFAAFIADFLRVRMLDSVNIFTIETVMSDKSKLEYMKLAKEKGYRIYLYFVSTQDVMINISRVFQRTKTGGHNVPKDKIVKRYEKSLDNLLFAVSLSDRAYIFDNSEENNPQWHVEYGEKNIRIKEDTIPQWIDKYLIQKAKKINNDKS